MSPAEHKQHTEQELRQVVRRLEDNAREKMERRYPGEDWSQTQFFYAVKRTCRELKEDGYLLPAAKPSSSGTRHLLIENVLERLENSRAETHHQIEVLEVIRDELWKLLVDNRHELDRTKAQLRDAKEALEHYSTKSDNAVAVETLAKIERREKGY